MFLSKCQSSKRALKILPVKGSRYLMIEGESKSHKFQVYVEVPS
jgi:hypothetical protein